MKIFEFIYSDGNDCGEIYFRNSPSSDLPVINQIFNEKVYSLDGWVHKQALEKYLIDEFKDLRPLIVDAGANIGASSVFFERAYKDALVVSIEPERYNYSLLKLNTVGKSIIPLEGAIASENGKMYLFDPGVGDVGFRAGSVGDYEVPTFSMDRIIEIGESGGAKPFICKIDIEGGESELFSKNTDWMDRFALIIIELHDWMLPMQGSSKSFLHAISKLDFEVLQKGENLFFFNRKFLL